MYLANYEHWPDPITILAVSAIAGSQIYAGQAAAAEGKSQQAIEKYNAAVMEQQAKATEQKTAFDQKRQAEVSERVMGTLEADLSASGAVTTVGSPLLIQAKQASELELENLMIGYEGQTEAARARSQAAGYRMQGKLARQVGKAKAIGSYIGAGGSLLSGFSTTGSRGSSSGNWGGGNVNPNPEKAWA